MDERLGGLVSEVVRAGVTVRRSIYPDLDVRFGEVVLQSLEAAGFAGAPRFLGYDDDGRQILTVVEGSLRPAPSSDDDLVAVLRTVRAFHDLTGGQVCHNDLAPRNTLWPGPVLIDWDLCAPGRPIEDVAHACWQFCALGPSEDPGTSARRVRLAADAYGLPPGSGRAGLVDEIRAWQERCANGIEARAAGGHRPWIELVERGAVEDVRASRAWLGDHRAAFEAQLC
jgi:hypothetical protein